ncbi:hypothetical protein TWF173_006639 [Orbilia oligospora]|nr:hypothetical protein TWF173_006639 [Orbilia oligospora]
MGVLSRGFTAAVSPLSLIFSLLQILVIHGRSIEVVQSLREFDLKSGHYGEVLDTITAKFLDKDLAWTRDSCLNLPISDKKWVVDRITYKPSDANPDFRWFLQYIVVFSGFNCKTNYHGAAAPPIRIDIENIEEPSAVPLWLQRQNYPYFGMIADPVVEKGTIKIKDPYKLLGRPMTAEEKAEASWAKGRGYLEKLKSQSLKEKERQTREMSEEEKEVLEIEARREFLKLEPVEYDIWPDYQFFGQASIRLVHDDELFHVTPDEEWTNRGDLGEELVPVITGGDFVDENGNFIAGIDTSDNR